MPLILRQFASHHRQLCPTLEHMLQKAGPLGWNSNVDISLCHVHVDINLCQHEQNMLKLNDLDRFRSHQTK